MTQKPIFTLTISKLPLELLSIIGDLLTVEELGALSQTSRLFARVLDPILYSQLAKHTHPNKKFFIYPSVKTVLEWAAYKGHVSMIDKMHARAAPPGVPTALKTKALSLAARHGHLATVIRLVELGAEIDTPISVDFGGEHTALHQATANGHKKVAQYLLDEGANVNTASKINDYTQGGTALEYTAKKANREMINFLLEHGADIKTQGVVACAVCTQDTEFLQYILEKGADVNSAQDQLYPPLYWAAAQGNIPMIRLLLKWGNNVTTPGNQLALHAAAGNGDEEISRLLLDHGMDSNCADDTGNRPLHWVAEYPQIDIEEPYSRERVARLLLERGADVFVANSNGQLPLDFARDWGATWIIDLLTAAMMKDPGYLRKKEAGEH